MDPADPNQFLPCRVHDLDLHEFDVPCTRRSTRLMRVLIVLSTYPVALSMTALRAMRASASGFGNLLPFITTKGLWWYLSQLAFIQRFDNALGGRMA